MPAFLSAEIAYAVLFLVIGLGALVYCALYHDLLAGLVLFSLCLFFSVMVGASTDVITSKAAPVHEEYVHELVTKDGVPCTVRVGDHTATITCAWND